MEEFEFVDAKDAGTTDGLKFGETSRRIGGVTITTTPPVILKREELLQKIKTEIPIDIDAAKKRYHNVQNIGKLMPDTVIKTIEVDESGKVLFEYNGKKYGTKINLDDINVLARLSDTTRRKVLIGDVSDNLLFLYDRIVTIGFEAIKKEHDQREESKKNFQPILPPELAKAIELERQKMIEKKKQSLGVQQQVSKPVLQSKSKSDDWNEDW